MANNTIKGAGDIYEKDLYGDLAKSAKEVLPLLDKINDALKETTKVNEKLVNTEAKTVEELNKLNKGLNQTEQAYKQKLDLDKERLKLEQRLSKGRTEEAQQNEELKIQISEETKERKRLAKETLGLTSAYQKESKRLNDLRKRYKDLVLEEGKATKETKKLEKEITKLDKELKEVDAAAGQFQRNVGNYPDTLGKATNAILAVAAAAGGASAAFNGVKTSLESTEEGSEDLQKVTAGLGAVWLKLKNTAAAAALDVFDYGKAVKENIDSGKGFIDSLKGQDEQFQRTGKQTENFVSDIKTLVEAETEAAERAIDLEKRIRGLEKAIAKTNEVIETQNAIAGDTTRSFNEIEIAAFKAQEAQQARANILISIAKEELQIIRDRIQARKDSNTSFIDLLDEEKDAVITLQEARTDAAVEQLETDKLLRENARDRFERELDFAIDAFDTTKTISERQIANERNNLEERNKNFKRLNILTESSFQSQLELIKSFTKEKIDLDELSKESDESVIRQRLRNFNFDDVTLGRILEIIKERKIATQDLADAQQELNDSNSESIDLNKDIIAQEEALYTIITSGAEESTEALKKLEEQRDLDNIENLERRLDAEKEGSITFLSLQKELNDALLDQQEKRLAKEDENRKEALEKEKEDAEQRAAIQDALLKKLEESILKRSEARQKDLEDQLDSSKENQDRLRELADKGSLDAQRSIAAETKKQAELQRAKEQEERKRELVTAGFKIFSALLDQGKDPSSATLETAALLGALPAIIEAVPAFYEGTESTGTVKNALDSNGGRLAMLHDNERVMTEKQNNKMGGISNDEAANIIQRYNMGELFDHNNVGFSDSLINSVSLNGMNKVLEGKIDELNQSIKNIKIPETTVKADELRNMLIITKKQGNKVEKQISKLH